MENMITEMVDELLDMEGDINIGGNIFTRSDILRSLDPTAYRELCIDTANSLIEDLQYDLDRLDPEVDADEIADIQVRIAELEDI